MLSDRVRECTCTYLDRKETTEHSKTNFVFQAFLQRPHTSFSASAEGNSEKKYSYSAFNFKLVNISYKIIIRGRPLIFF